MAEGFTVRLFVNVKRRQDENVVPYEFAELQPDLRGKVFAEHVSSQDAKLRFSSVQRSGYMMYE